MKLSASSVKRPHQNSKREKPQHSTEKTKSKREQRGWESYYDIYSMQMKPINDSVIETVAQDLVKWSLINEDLDFSFRISDFIDSRGLCTDTFYKWVATNKHMKAAHAFAMRRIGSRRERGACTRRFDSGSIFKSLGHYDSIERDEQKLRSEMNKAEEQVTREYNVTMRPATPPKEKEDLE